MARIIFLQRLWYEFGGIEALSACLKEAGHSVELAIGERLCDFEQECAGADIVAFSLMTGFQNWALSLGKQLKQRYGTFIVFGGPHPTYFPDIVSEEGVDAICRGEGEGALLDLAEKITKRQDITKISNLWMKQEGKIFQNEVRPLIADLDKLPFPDRSIYYSKYAFMRHNTHRPFISGRGCPYRCSFCFNERLREIYKDKGIYVRRRTPRNVIEEIKTTRGKYRTKIVFFHDDTFVMNQVWLKEFLSLYKKEVALPFYCQARADTLTQGLSKELKAAGCKCVFFAIESGNENIRKTILNKPISNEQIKIAARWLKEDGIKISTYNMLGIPGEEIKDAFETVELNIDIRADYPRCSFLTPYPGMRITETALKDGYLQDSDILNIDFNSQQNEMLIDSSEKNEIRNLHSLFQTAILFPWTYPVVKKLIRLPLGGLLRAWWAIIYFFVFTKSEGRSVKTMFIFALRNLTIDRTNQMGPMKTMLIKIANILFNYFHFLYKQLYFLYKRCNEKEEIKLLYEKIKPGMTVLDIGGNIGFYAILLSKLVGNKGCVYVFEPDPINYRYLKLNTKSLKNVYVNNYAIGSKTEKIKLYRSKELNWQHQTYDSGENRNFIEVECVTIDDYLKNSEKIDFIKIDIEGYDYFAFLGMKETIRRSKKIMVLGEFHPYWLKKAGICPDDFLIFLKDMCFSVDFLKARNNEDKPDVNDKYSHSNFYAYKTS